jgi:hypothetical protein
VTVASSFSIVEPISPELVLVDPALRQAVLSAMQRELEQAVRSSENGAVRPAHAAQSASRSAGAAASYEREIAEPEREATAQGVRAKIGSPQWWAAVVLYSFVVVALVIACSYLSRLI